MAQPRRDRHIELGEWTGVLSVLDVLNRREWTKRAACADSELIWIIDKAGNEELPNAVVPLLEICAGCAVRRECLADAFDTDESHETWGIFGGTTMLERRAARTVIGSSGSDAWKYRRAAAIPQIVDTFEATFEARLELWRDRLEERRVWMARFTLGSRGGPGRGHLGAAGRYAAKHGVSKRTALRRLKAKREAPESEEAARISTPDGLPGPR